MTDTKKLLTTKEAAEHLNVKPSTIHKYVKEGKLKPVYEDNWQLDATKLFYAEDIEELKQELIKPGITTGEAAEFLGLHNTTVSQYIQKGLLHAEKKPYKGRNIYFIEPSELERFKSEYELDKKREHKEYYDKDTGYAWFQAFSDPLGNLDNRILLDENGDPYLFTEDNRKIDINKIPSEGFQPITPIAEIDYIHRKGYAKFEFDISDTFFSIVDLFYQYLGPKNMKMTINNHKITVEVKPVYIKKELSNDIVLCLQKSLLEGSINSRLDGIMIDSDVETLAVSVPSELKKRIKVEADRANKTMEELVLEKLIEIFPYKM